MTKNAQMEKDMELITQTSHPKSGHKACINEGWDTNQLIS